MKILRLQLENFMTFNDLNVEWSPNINVISGFNGSGKTTILKAMYSALKTLGKAAPNETKGELERQFVEKICGVFRPDEMRIGRLASRARGRVKSSVSLDLSLSGKGRRLGSVAAKFTSGQQKGAAVERKNFETPPTPFDAVYLPPKEMISAFKSFQSLYEEYQIGFEETYYDLVKALARPLKRGKNRSEQDAVLNEIAGILPGGKKATVTRREDAFYLNAPGEGEYEMGLLAEGYRKIATLYYLVANGALNENSVLFWDEPEVNLHPRLIRPTVAALVELARHGAQIFVSTHNYFVQQEFNFAAVFPPTEKDKVKIRFYSLYKDDDKTTQVAEADRLAELKPNGIMEEFNEIYSRELDELDKRADDE